MAALKRTVSGRDHHDVAVGVGKTLSFDMPWLVQIALDETFTAAERCDRLAGRRVEEFGNLAQLPGDLETATTAAKSGLDRNRQPIFLGESDDGIGIVDRLGSAGNEGSADLLCDVASSHLVA